MAYKHCPSDCCLTCTDPLCCDVGDPAACEFCMYYLNEGCIKEIRMEDKECKQD